MKTIVAIFILLTILVVGLVLFLKKDAPVVPSVDANPTPSREVKDPAQEWCELYPEKCKG